MGKFQNLKIGKKSKKSGTCKFCEIKCTGNTCPECEEKLIDGEKLETNYQRL